MMTVKELMGGFQGVKYTMCFAYSPSVKRQMAVTQSSIVLASLLGMDVTLCYPEGLDVEEAVEQRCRETADRYGGKFTISHDRREGLAGAHWVNAKSWGCIKNLPPLSGEETELRRHREDIRGGQGLDHGRRGHVLDGQGLLYSLSALRPRVRGRGQRHRRTTVGGIPGGTKPLARPQGADGTDYGLAAGSRISWLELVFRRACNQWTSTIFSFWRLEPFNAPAGYNLRI